jgi:hypothetical protein
MVFSLLRHLQKNQKILQKFLELLSKKILPSMDQHLLLTDVLSNLFVAGTTPAVSILALSSLFILMRKYGINQKDYYDHLYRMLAVHRGALFESEHSIKFKKLVEISLRSSKVSMHIVCSFIKLLLRISLQVSGCHAMWIAAIILNLCIK